jgi:hypothetical protein
LNQESEREFSSLFVFKIKNISNNTSAAQPNLDGLSNSLMKKAFKFEPDNYQSGFAKPIIFDRKRTLLIPYYEIAEERVTEDITDKEKVGEAIPQTKTVQVQNLKYIVDANVYANDGLILVCRVDTIDRAEQILVEYLQTTRLKESYVYNFLYGQPSVIMQQLLLTLYDYWPTVQSQITSVRIGGKTISARYSGRGRYDLRLEDIDEEIRKRISDGEQIENITIKPPIDIAERIKIKRVVPKITINDVGIINCRANTNYENFALIKGFITETIKIIGDTIKGKRPRSYTRIEDFSGQATAIRDFLPTGIGVDDSNSSGSGLKI